MRRAGRSNACYHIHSHDEFSFGVIDEGEANYLNLNQKNAISAGTTVTINPDDAHSCNPKAGHWSYRMLFVNALWIGKLQQEMLGSYSQDYLPFPSLFETNHTLFQTFSELFETLLKETNPLIAESQLIQFLELCFIPESSNNITAIKVDLTRINQVKELIMDQLDTNHTLDEFSIQSGLSRYHLIRSFKQAYGQSPHAFQLDQRIKKAKSLLQQGNSIIDTAGLLGFADQSHFQRHFKKRIAVTPGQYQSFFI